MSPLARGFYRRNPEVKILSHFESGLGGVAGQAADADMMNSMLTASGFSGLPHPPSHELRGEPRGPVYNPGPEDWNRLRCTCCRAGLLLDIAKKGQTSRLAWMMQMSKDDEGSETGDRDDGIYEEDLAVRAQHPSAAWQPARLYRRSHWAATVSCCLLRTGKAFGRRRCWRR